MGFYSLAFALTIAFLLALLFTRLTKSPGPWGSFWVLFTVLALAIWVASIWITPIGPMWYGVAWIDLLVVGLLLVLLFGAVGEASRKQPRSTPASEEEVDLVAASKQDTTAIALFGVFFWIFIASLVVLAIVGVANLG